MKRLASIGIIVVLVVLSFVACGKKAGAPGAGGATAENMAALFPTDSAGLMVIDIHRAMQTEPANKMINDKETAQKYQEFIKETGIDPQKDVYYLAGALIGDIQHPEGALVINARFNKDALLAKIKEKAGALKESVYEGMTIYEIRPPEKETPAETPKMGEEKSEESEGQEKAVSEESQEPPAETPKTPEKPGYGAFLNESNIALGTEPGVKAVIDVLKNKKENVFKNAELAKLIKESNKDAMLWAVMNFPPEAIKKMTETNPMLSSLSGVHSVILSFDYRDKAVLAEIKIMNKDEQKNKQIADFLTGMKALGGMAGSSKPEVGELMNKIVVSSGPNYVSVNADIPEELLNKLGEEAKKAMPQTVKGEEKTEEPKTEK